MRPPGRRGSAGAGPSPTALAVDAAADLAAHIVEPLAEEVLIERS